MGTDRKQIKRERTLSLNSVQAKTREQVCKIKSDALEGFTLRDVDELNRRGSEALSFTFEDFDRNHEYFNLSHIGAEWYVLLLDKLKELSGYTWSHILHTSHYNAHPHDWNKTTAQFTKEKYEQFDGVQFSLGQGFGRVHGYVIGNLFYIVWLDKHHNLYDVEGYENLRSKLKRLKQPGNSCLGVINNQINLLNEECACLRYENAEIKENFQRLQNEYDAFLIEDEKTLKANEELQAIIDAKKKKQDKYNKRFKNRK